MWTRLSAGIAIVSAQKVTCRGQVANSESTAGGRCLRPGGVNMGNLPPLATGRKTARWAARNPCSNGGGSSHSCSFAVSHAPFFICSSWEGFWMLSCASWKSSSDSEGSKKSEASAQITLCDTSANATMARATAMLVNVAGSRTGTPKTKLARLFVLVRSQQPRDRNPRGKALRPRKGING
jgi:hypothetical protein